MRVRQASLLILDNKHICLAMTEYLMLKKVIYQLLTLHFKTRAIRSARSPCRCDGSPFVYLYRLRWTSGQLGFAVNVTNRDGVPYCCIIAIELRNEFVLSRGPPLYEEGKMTGRPVPGSDRGSNSSKIEPRIQHFSMPSIVT